MKKKESYKLQILIEDLSFEAIIGILDFERLTPQKVVINCIIEYEFQKDSFINYADVAKHIENSMKKEKFLLLEDAILSLKSSLKEIFPLISTLSLKISKPDILHNCEVSLQEKFIF